MEALVSDKGAAVELLGAKHFHCALALRDVVRAAGSSVAALCSSTGFPPHRACSRLSASINSLPHSISSLRATSVAMLKDSAPPAFA
ncbi:hypothetical protein HaLaN_10278 [Haematococcus lacustris]|uniref:Uncharacterized protein n=1 Tax=Haematococcus lacustris TaxID=44745 RepID=A0A699YVH0_HAELA|nr:hypothetical protein HaLaN_10278 [Haematococcus lacustris]